MSKVTDALAALHERYQQQYSAAGSITKTEYIEEWNSPCYQGNAFGGEVAWVPVAQQPPISFENVEKALELPLHKSIKDYFSNYWAGDLDVRFRGIELTLLQVQSPQDAERLQQNLIGHVLMKQRLKQNLTLFFGVGIEDDLMLSIDNETGAVGLEYAGQDQHEILAGDLERFLEGCETFIR